ncbi:MAG TPA: ABC transporter permease [Panacibacter sp.]|nr:ABC transporter permease [Panacibacter sp.]
MKQFFTFVKKEWFHIWRDKRTLLILFGMPIVQVMIFGFALTNEVKNSKIGILDLSKDEATAKLSERISASRYFDLVQNLKSNSDIDASFKKGETKMVIVFPEHFRESLLHSNAAQVQLIADASDPNTATTLINYASAIINEYQDELLGEKKLPYTITTQTRMLYNPQQKGAYNFVPGVMAMILMLVCTMMTSIAIVKEKETGTMEVLLVSPLKPLLVIIAKAVPYLLLSIVNIISILLLSVYVLEVPIAGSLVLLILTSILFIITSLSLGLLISSLTGSQQTAMLISLMGLFMPTLLFSGFMFPIENMPLPLQIVSNIVPAKWYYYIVKSVMIKGLGFDAIWHEVLILTSMTIVLLGLSIKKYNVRLA